MADDLAGPRQALDGAGETVAGWIGPLFVVQRRWTVDRGRDVNLVIAAKRQGVRVQVMQGRDQREAHVASVHRVEPLDLQDDALDQVEAQGGLSALELDGQGLGGRFKHPVDRRPGVLP